jgi:hypothetical protein
MDDPLVSEPFVVNKSPIDTLTVSCSAMFGASSVMFGISSVKLGSTTVMIVLWGHQIDQFGDIIYKQEIEFFSNSLFAGNVFFHISGLRPGSGKCFTSQFI